jgi:hypothetical protein
MSVTKKEFEAKINEVGGNLYLSHFHLKIHEKMTEELNARLGEYPAFFDWSRMAHYKTGVLGLTIAYDRNSLGLLKIIHILQSDYKDWNLDDTLDNEQLEQDKNFVSRDKNQLVENLIHLRDKVISHMDSKLHPKKLDLNLQNIYGGELILQRGIITTEEIEKLPESEKNQRLRQASFDTFEALDKEKNKILGKQIPSFEQFYELTTKGIEICNKYMPKVGLHPIELKLEGID